MTETKVFLLAEAAAEDSNRPQSQSEENLCRVHKGEFWSWMQYVIWFKNQILIAVVAYNYDVISDVGMGAPDWLNYRLQAQSDHLVEGYEVKFLQ